MRRVAIDVASQLLPIASSFFDRILLSALIVRYWGVSGFEFWSLVAAAASLLAVIDSGCLMNFSNMIVRHYERGERAKAIAVYRQTNTIFFIIAAIGIIIAAIAALLPAFQRTLGIPANPDHAGAMIAVFCLGASVAVRLAFSNFLTVYRVSFAFARGTALSTFADLVRILAIGLAVVLGGGIAGAAIASLAGTVIGYLVTIFFDLEKRYPDFAFRAAVPKAADLKGSLWTSLQFAVPYFAIVAIAQGPVLLLGGDSALGSGTIAIFVLMRTFSNFARSIIVRATNVMGMEIARHSLRGDDNVAQRLLNPLGWVNALVFGACAGVMVHYGATLTRIWTGSNQLFDVQVIAVMMAPLVLIPSYLLANPFVQYRNTPLVWTIGSFAHVLLALLLYFVLTPLPLVHRLTISVYAAEIFAVGLPVTLVAMGGVRWAVIVREAGKGCVGLLVAGLVIGIGMMTDSFVPQERLPGLLLGLTVVGLIFAGGLYLIGGYVYRSLRLTQAAVSAAAAQKPDYSLGEDRSL